MYHAAGRAKAIILVPLENWCIRPVLFVTQLLAELHQNDQMAVMVLGRIFGGLAPHHLGGKSKIWGLGQDLGGLPNGVKFRKIFRGHKPGPPYIWQWSIHRYNQMVTEYGDMARPGLGILYGRSTAVCSTEFPLGSRDCSDFIQCRLKSRIRFALNGTDQFYIFIYLS